MEKLLVTPTEAAVLYDALLLVIRSGCAKEPELFDAVHSARNKLHKLPSVRAAIAKHGKPVKESK